MTARAKIYYVTLELDAESGQWMADVEGLPVHTWARTLGKVRQYVREALAAHEGVTLTDLTGRLEFRPPSLPAGVVDALNHAAATSSAAQDAATRAAEAKAGAARALVQDAHLSMRDAGEFLGVSHQRIQQLIGR